MDTVNLLCESCNSINLREKGKPRRRCDHCGCHYSFLVPLNSSTGTSSTSEKRHPPFSLNLKWLALSKYHRSEALAWIICSVIGIAIFGTVYGSCWLLINFGATIAQPLIYSVVFLVVLGAVLIFLVAMRDSIQRENWQRERNQSGQNNKSQSGVWAVLIAIVLLTGLSNSDSDSTQGNYSPYSGKPYDTPQEHWDYVNNRLRSELPSTTSQRDIDSASRAIFEYEKRRKARED